MLFVLEDGYFVKPYCQLVKLFSHERSKARLVDKPNGSFISTIVSKMLDSFKNTNSINEKKYIKEIRIALTGQRKF